MMQVTSIEELKTVVNQNGEMIITIDNNEIIIMNMEEYYEKIMKKEIEEHLLRAEDDMDNGNVKDAREVLKEWKEKYEI